MPIQPTRFDFVSLGETMIRLSPPNFERISQAQSLDIQIGGAESNVAVAMSRLGFKTAWLSRLPDNALGQRVTAELRAHGVNTTGVRFAPNERMGTYFIELAVPPRPNRVVYDRAGSAASKMTLADVDLDILTQTRWLHMTGITPALSSSCLELTIGVIQMARNIGVTVSFDVNYRALLWSPSQAGAALATILPHCDVVFAAHRDAIALLQAPDDASAAATELQNRFGNRIFVLTIGESGAIAQTNTGQLHIDQPFKVPQIVDRIGAGDAFDAGFIAGQLWDKSVEDSLLCGNALSALKLTMPGDLALVSKDELYALIGGGKSASLR
jgi:2-dehydro-3-deoxygluconokinase